MKIEKDRADVTVRRAPRAHARQPGRAADREPRLPQLGGADEPVAGRGGGGRGAPAAPRPRRPGRACRSSASPTSATCSSARSARETAARVAAGALAKALPARARRRGLLARDPDRLGARRRSATTSARRTSRAWTSRPCAASTPAASEAMVAEIDTRAQGQRVARRGVRGASPSALVPGIGSHVSWEERLDGRLAEAIMSIQAMKGVGIGDGFDLAGRVGSQAHDEIFCSEEHGFYRETNRAGGLEGGMTTGDPLVVRARDEAAADADQAAAQRGPRHQGAGRRRCASAPTPARCPAAGVVAEAMVALVLAAAYREKLGGDHIDDVAAALRAYEERIGWRRASQHGRARLRRLHGRGQVDRRPHAGGRARGARRSTPTASSSSAGRADRGVLRPRGRGRLPRARGGGGAASCSARAERRGDRARRRRGAVRARARGAGRATRSCTSRSSPSDAWRRASGKGRPLARDRGRFDAAARATARRSTSRWPTP